jgi:phosphoglycolate phosphatase-like HAD superfamily hydrolase
MDQFKHFKAEAIIFDKDGTLIDFDAMWGGWTVYLADQLQQTSGINVREALYMAMGYDESRKKVLANGKLAATPMSQLYQLTVEILQSLGLDEKKAKLVVEQAWCIPDPVLLAKPFTDTRALFASLHDKGIRIAIATADDRTPTQAMIEAFDIEEYITTMVCANDGIPPKPAPDMVLSICEQMKIHPAKVMVVGDTISDLKMARSAGAGLAVGVLSGVSSARDLALHADLLLESVDELHRYATARSSKDAVQTQNGLNPDFAF